MGNTILDEKQRMIRALKITEEVRRMTGRTTRVVAEAVEYVFGAREPAVLVGADKATTERMVEMAHEKIGACMRGDAGDQVKGLVTGCTYAGMGDLRGTPARVFEDHYVTLTRAIEAIEKL
jgi:hypothetical protein